MMARVAADGSRCPGTRAHRALSGSPGVGGPALISSKLRPRATRTSMRSKIDAEVTKGSLRGRHSCGGGTSGGVTHTPSAASLPGEPTAAFTVRISVSPT
jgi:hypothetical protein